MADVAHLVRATGCGSVGRGFDPLHSPQIYTSLTLSGGAIYFQRLFGRLVVSSLGLLRLDHD